MKGTLTVRLDPDPERLLRRQLALRRFEELRRRVLPFAEARGYLTDEDVLQNLS
jgi:hypothetical protein